MNLEITGRHVTMGDDLRKHVRGRLDHVLRHVKADVTSAHVIFAKERAKHVAEVVLHGRNLNTAVKGDGDDLFLAMDRAADKLKHQLERKQDRRLVGMRKGGRRLTAAEAAAAAEAEAIAALAAEGGTKGRKAARKPVKEAGPPVVRMRAGRLRALSIDQAVAKLEADKLGFLLFKDASGQACVLHRLSDGTLSLVESGIE